MQSIIVREYARLTTAPVPEPTIDEAQIPETAFEWLCKESARLRRSGASLVQLDDRRWLRLDNYVGVIETPCGTRVEVLPKSVDGAEGVSQARVLLRRMLSRCLKLEARETGPASIQTFGGSLTEWVMRQYLDALDMLVKRGVRFEYHSVREQQRFLRGRLDVTRQLRQPPGRQHLFQIEHDIFDADRPENRLLRSALDRVCRVTRDPGNWRLSHELVSYMAPVPPSNDMATDFKRWRDDRLMAHYRPVRPWCSLILNEQTPLSVLGEWHGRSLLFPMEKLFERFVEACLRRNLPEGATLKPSSSSKYLCVHRSEDWFQLKPDFIVEYEGERWVLDTKWKRLDTALGTRKDKYSLNQADFYQLFAYGHRYLDGVGKMLLVYPKTSAFQEPLQEFEYSGDLRLHVVPFDLEQEALLANFLPGRAQEPAEAA